ncbi:DUF4221 family protein [Dysgonomonas mossii]|uniref:DUF4221 family protein n=1 Tax=Dysgonomonas mossii TaxID=163665 RepID=UPI003994463C
MKKTKCLSLIIIIQICISCNSKIQDNDSVSLVDANLDLGYSLDENTKQMILAFFPYTDEDGKEYITFQNERKNEILFYDMNSGDFLYKLQPEYEGPNGVGRFLGYFIKDLENIFLTSGLPVISQIEYNGNLKEKYSFANTTTGIPLYEYNSLSYIYTPIVVIDNNLYITSYCNRLAGTNPVSAVINMNTKEVSALPFEYPIFEASKNKIFENNQLESFLSRCYDGKNFIYSFYFDEDIYVASIDHKTVRKISVKSKYISKVQFPNMQTGDPMKNICENPNYGNLYYDPYRKVYYRVAYPEVNIDKNENFRDLWHYGRKNFSIIILDKDFNIIGETLFPDFTYISTLMFVNKDGLYISNSHYRNLDYNEDNLNFVCFNLDYK